jgi:hypothetical protein
VKWKVLAFWGKEHIGCHLGDDEPVTLADGGTQLVKKLFFKKEQLELKVGDCAPVNVKTLLLPSLCIEKKRAYKNTPLHPPHMEFPLLLGRDMIFKYFSMYCTKLVNEEPKIHLFNRVEVTPPSSPLATANFSPSFVDVEDVMNNLKTKSTEFKDKVKDKFKSFMR